MLCVSYDLVLDIVLRKLFLTHFKKIDPNIMSKINSDPSVKKIMEHFPETEVKSFNNMEDPKNESNETE